MDSKSSRALREATRELLRRLCEAVAREMALRAELERLRKEIAAMTPGGIESKPCRKH